MKHTISERETLNYSTKIPCTNNSNTLKPTKCSVECSLFDFVAISLEMVSNNAFGSIRDIILREMPSNHFYCLPTMQDDHDVDDDVDENN